MPLLLALTFGSSIHEVKGAKVGQEAVASTGFPSLAGRVTDVAQVLTGQQKNRLSAKLELIEQTTGHQMIVVTVPTLGGRDIAGFARDLGNTWGIGRKGYDDGVILLVAPRERRIRIAVGYGLEEALPNALCKQIIDKQMLPHFRNDDLAGGIEAGVDALASRLR